MRQTCPFRLWGCCVHAENWSSCFTKHQVLFGGVGSAATIRSRLTSSDRPCFANRLAVEPARRAMPVRLNQLVQARCRSARSSSRCCTRTRSACNALIGSASNGLRLSLRRPRIFFFGNQPSSWLLYQRISSSTWRINRSSRSCLLDTAPTRSGR